MAKEYARTFYSSQRWRECRQAYIRQRQAIDGGMCELCHERLGEIVHHKIMLDESNINDAEVTLNFKNLKLECQTCHNREEHGRSRENRYTFSGGEIVPIPPFSE